MAVSYTIDPALRLVTFEVDEHLPSLADLQRVLDQLAADSLFKRGFGVLTKVHGYPVEPAFARSALTVIAARLTQFGASRWAFLTSNRESYYTRLSVELYARGHGIQYRVFMDESEAITWLLDAEKEG